MTEEEQIIRIPEPVGYPIPQAEPIVAPEYEVVPEAKPEEANSVEDLSDMTAASREDILGKLDGNSGFDDTSDITGLDEEAMDDLFGVSREDIIGAEPEERKPKPRLIRRTTKRDYSPPPTILRGIR